jgi:flagellar FliJ protein
MQRILDLRAHKEQQWEMKLGKITGECLTIENEITHRREEIFRVRAKPGVAVDQAYRAAVEQYITRLLIEIEELTVKLEQKQKERQKVQEKFLEASRDRKILDSLKEKREQQYRREQNREDMKILDDLAGAQAVRKMAEG